MRTIYCDEAGFTGNRLWDDDQPFFAYASIEIEPSSALSIVADIKRSCRIDSTELKGGTLCRKPRGRRAVRRVIEEHGSRANVIVFDKRYAIAAKMWEYLFEPALAPMSLLLYDIGFHKFIANGLYTQMRTGDASAKTAFVRFQNALRNRNNESLLAVEGALTNFSVESFVDQALTFLICNRKHVAHEVVSNFQAAAGGWLLELSSTALTSLLSTHGEDMQPMEVFCDESKPLADQLELFDSMIGRTDRRIIKFDGREHQLTYNLAKRIQLVNSETSPGVQLADIFASATVFAMKNPADELSQLWGRHCERFLHGNTLLPEFDCFDLRNPKAIVNYIVFQGLLDHALRGQSYFTALPQLILAAKAAVAADPQQFYPKPMGRP